MSKLQWHRTAQGYYVSGKYLISWRPNRSRRYWDLSDEGRSVSRGAGRLGTLKALAQRIADGDKS